MSEAAKGLKERDYTNQQHADDVAWALNEIERLREERDELKRQIREHDIPGRDF